MEGAFCQSIKQAGFTFILHHSSNKVHSLEISLSLPINICIFSEQKWYIKAVHQTLFCVGAYTAINNVLCRNRSLVYKTD